MADLFLDQSILLIVDTILKKNKLPVLAIVDRLALTLAIDGYVYIQGVRIKPHSKLLCMGFEERIKNMVEKDNLLLALPEMRGTLDFPGLIKLQKNPHYLRAIEDRLQRIESNLGKKASHIYEIINDAIKEKSKFQTEFRFLKWLQYEKASYLNIHEKNAISFRIGIIEGFKNPSRVIPPSKFCIRFDPVHILLLAIDEQSRSFFLLNSIIENQITVDTCVLIRRNGHIGKTNCDKAATMIRKLGVRQRNIFEIEEYVTGHSGAAHETHSIINEIKQKYYVPPKLVLDLTRMTDEIYVSLLDIFFSESVDCTAYYSEPLFYNDIATSGLEELCTIVGNNSKIKSHDFLSVQEGLDPKPIIDAVDEMSNKDQQIILGEPMGDSRHPQHNSWVNRARKGHIEIEEREYVTVKPLPTISPRKIAEWVIDGVSQANLHNGKQVVLPGGNKIQKITTCSVAHILNKEDTCSIIVKEVTPKEQKPHQVRGIARVIEVPLFLWRR